MNFTVPDLCDEFFPQIKILDPVFSTFGGQHKFQGKVVTIKCFEDNSLVKETLNSDGWGKVLVVDGGGSLRCALLGDMLAAMAARNGWQGIVINGCVRDVEILKTINIGVYALNCFPLKSKKRGQGELNVTLEFAGVRFEPDNYLYADENGIVLAKRALDSS